MIATTLIRSDKFVEHMRRHHPSEEAADRVKPAGGRVSATAVGPPSLEGRKRRKSSPVATPSLLVAAGGAAEIKLESSPRQDVAQVGSGIKF